MAKAAGALGQTFAGGVLYDDLVAFDVLAADEGTDPAHLGTFGFSGGAVAACCSRRCSIGSRHAW